MDGGDGAFGGVEATVNAVVRAVRNEVKLHSALADKTVPFLMVYAEGETLEEVLASLPATPKAWTETFAEAWAAVAETQMPSMVSDRAAVWAGVGKTPPPPAAAAAAAFGGEGAAGRGGAAGSISGSGPFGDDYLAKMMEGLNVSEHDKTKLINDVTVQRISGLRILSLSLSLMSGHVHPLGEAAELRYGSDMRLCPLVKAQRKAGVESLDDLLKAKNKRHVAQHFTRLAKEYNDRQMIEEATLVSQFWAETSAAFEGDDSGLFTYMLEWNRHYAGRGIPKLLDTDLILRNMGRKGGAGDSAELKELRTAVATANSKVKAAEETSSSMLKRLQKLESAAGQEKTKGGEGAKSCFICGGDHLARNCPTKKGGGGKGSGGGAADKPIIDITEE